MEGPNNDHTELLWVNLRGHGGGVEGKEAVEKPGDLANALRCSYTFK